jgi:hypothetical protein
VVIFFFAFPSKQPFSLLVARLPDLFGLPDAPSLLLFFLLRLSKNQKAFGAGSSLRLLITTHSFSLSTFESLPRNFFL